MNTEFNIGEKVIWTPVKSRRGYHGHEDALKPLMCEIINRSNARGTYYVKIIDRFAMVNSKNKFEVVPSSLRKP